MKKLRIILAVLLVKSSERLAGLLLTGRRKSVDGRRIDAKAQAVGQLVNLLRDSDAEPVLEESRQGIRNLAEKLDEPCPDGVHKREVFLPGGDGPRPARLYDAQPIEDNQSRPTLLFLHGGGWIQGDLNTHDGMCGKLALWAGIRVISLEYRLAPENKFPAAADDVLAAYRAMLETPNEWGIDPSRLAVGGDSAGGNLTAGLMHDLQGLGLPLPAAQMLLYPGVDARMNSASMQSLTDAYLLPLKRINWFMDLYLPEGQSRMAPRLSPLFSEHLSGQPEALIVAAGHDPLWDDSLNYAQALRQAGVAVNLLQYPGQVHAFMSITDAIPQGNHAIRQAADWLAERLT